MRKSEIRPTDTNKMGDVIAREKEGKGLVMVIQDDLSPKKAYEQYIWRYAYSMLKEYKNGISLPG